MSICCPDYPRKSLKHKRCTLGAGESSCTLSSLFPHWRSAFSQPTQGPPDPAQPGWGEAKMSREAVSYSAWGLQSAANNMGVANTHTQLLTSAGSLEVAGDRTTCGHGDQGWGAGVCFPS